MFDAACFAAEAAAAVRLDVVVLETARRSCTPRRLRISIRQAPEPAPSPGGTGDGAAAATLERTAAPALLHLHRGRATCEVRIELDGRAATEGEPARPRTPWLVALRAELCMLGPEGAVPMASALGALSLPLPFHVATSTEMNATKKAAGEIKMAAGEIKMAAGERAVGEMADERLASGAAACTPAARRLTASAAASLVPAPAPGTASQPRRLVSPPSRILPDLLLGDHGASIQYEALVDAGVTHILNVKGGARAPPPPYDTQLSLHCVKISDFGDDDLRTHLAACFAVIDAASDAGGGCLVHCSQGVNRSPSIVLCYLMCSPRTRWSLREAWAHVSARRPMASPHHLYWRQLQAIECKQLGVAKPSLSAQVLEIT